MIRRIQDSYIYMTGVILLVTAAIKWFGAATGAPVLDWHDPLLPLSNRETFVLAGAMELGLSAYLFLGEQRGMKIMSIAWLAGIYLTYRLGLWWAGVPDLCNCLGNLSGWFPVSPLTLDWIAWSLLGWLLIGSLLILMTGWLHRWKTNRTKMAA